mmetsp:Transcript_24504/g.34430  ORF Transcript_24504/g.34430 Transcript_24504/m.34430 type:complete len:85 (-) Transcript_24504:47-301(-)
MDAAGHIDFTRLELWYSTLPPVVRPKGQDLGVTTEQYGMHCTCRNVFISQSGRQSGNVALTTPIVAYAKGISIIPKENGVQPTS